MSEKEKSREAEEVGVSADSLHPDYYADEEFDEDWDEEFRPKDGKLVLQLYFVTGGIGDGAIEVYYYRKRYYVVTDEYNNGPYSCFEDALSRTGVNSYCVSICCPRLSVKKLVKRFLSDDEEGRRIQINGQLYINKKGKWVKAKEEEKTWRDRD